MSQINNKRTAIHRSDGKQKRKRRNQPKKQTTFRDHVYYKASQQALRDINQIRRFINTEIHYIDVTGSDNSSTTATFALMNGCQIGDTAVTRTGNSTKLNGASIKFTLSKGTTATLSFERILVVLDRQPNQAIFPIANLLSATTVVSPYVPESKDRFAVLYDQSFRLADSNDFGMIVESNIGIQNHVDYSSTGNAGTVADILSNSLYFVHLSNQAVNFVNVTYYLRTWFIDN